MRERARAPAKINLLLRVHERDPTGYHAVETLFCALELADELTIDVATGHGVRLEVEGPDLGPVDDNLAVRAARAFLSQARVDRDVAIRIRKRIPVGGGLGGGSSDAAAVLRALDRLMPGTVQDHVLKGTARDLGSDVPFFLSGLPQAWGTGRGDRLDPAPALPSVPVLLVVPPFPIPTASAYGWLDADRASGKGSAVADGASIRPAATWDELAAVAMNDFEGPVYARHPELLEIRDGLRSAGALLSLLSGSGSTIFGVFNDEDRASAAVADLRARNPGVRWELTRTASR